MNWCFTKQAFWFTIFGYGFHFKSTPPLFSERNGYEKFLKLTSKWRARIITRKDQ